MEIQSSRITFFPINLEIAQILMKNPLAFYYKFQLPWNKNWPHHGLKALLPIYAENLEEDEDQFGFGPWVMIDNGREHVIGDIGFKGRPDSEGTLEIGYHVVVSERNQGYASEAVAKMCDWAFSNREVKGVEAQCDKNNIPSQKVLINNGFNHTGREGDVFLFKKEKSRNNSMPQRSESE
ncbi:GNAT family N-acetyltransferase [Halobacillus salinarum]|uniref:GNAT family N-acetyltransferase n=1 Tax=Halobacillus salinarum TaxID=2932257 RepID=A0ABY4EFB3_9BACI|nr:GNAT family N-acetyltransferase [Halobacillus salinarum]UOQ43161.1 GNAT family N-acetyltransferase [Halobacillus salinarum]